MPREAIPVTALPVPAALVVLGTPLVHARGLSLSQWPFGSVAIPHPGSSLIRWIGGCGSSYKKPRP